MHEDADEHSEPKSSPEFDGAGFNVSIKVTDFFGVGRVAKGLKPATAAIVNGLSKIYEPASIYLNQRADNAAKRHEALAEVKFISKMNHDLSLDQEVIANIKTRFINTESRHQKNIEDAILLTADYSENGDEKKANELDEDFVFEWVDGVKSVSSEEVRKIWAGILASAPHTKAGRISKPAVNMLKDFDPNIAASFLNYITLIKICGLPSLTLPFNAWEKFGLNIDSRLLVEIGILASIEGIHFMQVGPFKATQIVSPRTILPRPQRTMSAIVMSERASELYKSVPTREIQISDEARSEIFELNLRSLSIDPDWNLRLSVKEDEALSLIIEISKYENGFLSVESHQSDSELASVNADIDTFSDDIPEYCKSVFRKLASEGKIHVRFEEANSKN